MRQKTNRFRFIKSSGPNVRIRTIAALIANIRKAGQVPTDEAIAGFLACSVEKVQQQRKRLKETTE